jgi:hypothetical protein
VGPALRHATSTNAWATFEVTVTGERSSDGAILATISTFVADGAPQPLCVGNLVAEKAAACADPRVHIHPAAQAGAGAPWALVPAGGGVFAIASTGRAEGCATHLTARFSCATSALALAPADGSELQLWVLEPANGEPEDNGRWGRAV